MRVKGHHLISKDEELEDKFIPDTIQTQNPSIINIVTDDMDIKQEGMDDVEFHHNSTEDSQDEDLDLEPETESTIPHIDCGSVKSTEKDVNGFYLVLLRCKEGCETCLKYMRVLSEHVKTAHALPQSIQDPLLIDPLHIDPDPPHAHPSSSVQIKCEVEETIEKIEYSGEESDSFESDPDFELESENESDPEYSPSTHSTRNAKNSGNKTCTGKERLAVHTDATKDNPFKCDTCEKTFRRKNTLTAHMLIHVGKKCHVCKDCGLGFISLGRLTQHRTSHREEKPFKCDVCGKSFKIMSGLNTHKIIHMADKPHKCEYCGRGFNERSSMKLHIRTHTGEKPYKCDLCEKSFRKVTRLNEHTRVHTGESPFKCDECEMSFRRSDKLRIHKRTHTGEKPYSCDECKKCFSESGSLSRHRRIHTGEKSYECEQCKKCFSESGSLRRHRRTHTGKNKKPYPRDVPDKFQGRVI